MQAAFSKHMPYLTVLDHAASKPQTKNFNAGTSYSRTKRVLGVRRLKFKTHKELRAHLQLLAAEAASCVIRGKPKPDLELPTPRKRTYFNDAPTSWVMLDVDKLKLPKHLRTTPYTDEHAAFAASKLPTEFQGVRAVWQASASAGRKPRILKLHLWYLLSQPLTAVQLRAWLGKCTAIDPSTLRVVQPHYTAAPIGAEAFYEGKRIGTLKGPLLRVSVPEDLQVEEFSSETLMPKRPHGVANVSREIVTHSAKLAHKRAQTALDNCSVAYQTAYEIGTILGPSVALETWNDAEHGHETWRAASENVVAAWADRVAAVPGASHGVELYAERILQGIEWGVARERERLSTRSQKALEAQLAATASVRETLLKRMYAHVGSEKTLREVGRELGRYWPQMGDALVRALQDASALSEQQVRDALSDGVSEEVAADAWREGLLMRGKHADEIVPNDSNIRLIFQTYPGFIAGFRFNVRTKQLEATASNVLGLPAGRTNPETLPGILLDWLRPLGCPNAGINQVYGLFCSMFDKFEHYDPFLVAFPEALLPRAEALAELDKLKPRLDNWLHKYFGCKDNEYTRLIASKALIAAVARAVEPGCQVDTMLVLQGEQGIGKTNVLRTLGGVIPQGYQELLDMKDKDSLIAMNDGLIVEVSELKALRYSNEETSKAFFSRKRDRIRAPYARATQDYDRRIVFVGTTNDPEFLSDHQNRRYWPATCVEICRMTHKQARKLWREAALRYASGEQWWLETAEEKELQRKHVARFRNVDVVEEMLAAWLRNKTQVTMHEVCAALFPDRALSPHAHDRRVTAALRVLGWRVGKREKNVRLWVRHQSQQVF